ncbi:MAG: 50S ribosomal protein L6, partial [Leptospira sp.]|nr:50S ribosomal protein L6 [Leptospira sp.]
MSRVGKAIVTIPPKVEIKDNGNSILVKGPLGEISTPIFEGISLNQENETVS